MRRFAPCLPEIPSMGERGRKPSSITSRPASTSHHSRWGLCVLRTSISTLVICLCSLTPRGDILAFGFRGRKSSPGFNDSSLLSSRRPVGIAEALGFVLAARSDPPNSIRVCGKIDNLAFAKQGLQHGRRQNRRRLSQTSGP
jgi:hypothetical protein